jgi:hypothetical protein
VRDYLPWKAVAALRIRTLRGGNYCRRRKREQRRGAPICCPGHPRATSLLRVRPKLTQPLVVDQRIA